MALVQSISFMSSSTFSKNNGQHQISPQTTNTRNVKMLYSTIQTHGIRIQTPSLAILGGFNGLRGSNNALDTLVFSGQDFHSKVATSLRVPGGRGSRCVAKAIFERFREPSFKVIMLSQEEATRLGHNYVGTEQILLGLISEGSSIAAKVLKSMGISLKDARVEVEKIIGRGTGFVGVEIPFTPNAKRVLEHSVEEARHLGHNYIGPEHLLLGLLREGEGGAACVLENLGADPTNIRTQVIQMVAESTKTVGAGVGGATLEECRTNLTKLAEKVIKLDMGLLVAGTKDHAEFEERVKKLMKEEMKQSDDIINILILIIKITWEMGRKVVN